METKTNTVSFSGYRGHKIKLAYDTPDAPTKIREEIDRVIKSLYDRGYRLFLSGMAEGFDTIAAEAVLALKEQHEDIELVAVVPFKGQEYKFETSDIFRYKQVMKSIGKAVYTAECYHTNAYYDRNDYLVNNSSLLVCFYSGIKGGTEYTHKKAKAEGLEVINIFTTLDKTPNLFN